MDRNLHRRENPRLQLGIEAEFIGLNGRQRVTLQDLSATGARLEAQCEEGISRGFLRWMDFETFGEVAWIAGRWFGLTFDRPLSNPCLVATRSAAPQLLREAQTVGHRYAEEFVKGVAV